MNCNHIKQIKAEICFRLLKFVMLCLVRIEPENVSFLSKKLKQTDNYKYKIERESKYCSLSNTAINNSAH